MKFCSALTLAFLTTLFLLPVSSTPWDSSDSSDDDDMNGAIKKEVCVIGGGAAGAYTAYELQKRGYDTVLFEPQSSLGGNCEILEFPSKLTPGLQYTVNAAVIIFSPRQVVLDFFNEFNAPTGNLPAGGSGNTFVYGPGFVFPAPPQDPAVLSAALVNFTIISNLPPYAGITEIPPLPDWENLSPVQQDALLEPFGDFLARNPGVLPLRPLISALMQGFGFVDTRPMWEIFAFGGPVFLTQLFSGTFLTLPEGCQSIYDDLQGRMLANDPDSVKLSTWVKKVRRKGNKVVFKAFESDGTKKKYKCDDAIVAFRPNGIDTKFLKDITPTEQAFFDDLGYNGYIPSVWEMDLGPSLLAVGANQSTALNFNFFQAVDVGIITLSKDRPEADYPWRLFYQPAEPAETPEALDAIQDQIVQDLTALGFINIKNLFISNHVYAVKPQSRENTLVWTDFFNQANNDGDHLFWTGSVPSGEGSENVWQYSWDLLEANFPSKTNVINV